MDSFEDLEKKLYGAIENYDEFKHKELQRIGLMYQTEVKRECPVDTGWLRAHIDIVKVSADNMSVTVGTNVEYAKFVEEGHMQHERWLPGYFRANGGFQYLPRAEANGRGIKLKEKFIPGRWFFRNSLKKLRPKLKKEIQDFYDYMLKQI
jgi:hypothetical protein